MKRFEILAKFGRKVFYKSVLSFTLEQEKEYLKKVVIGAEDINRMFSGELERVVIKAIGVRAWSKDADMWGSISRKECAEKYPDYAICAHVMAQFYNFVSNHEIYLDTPKETEEVQVHIDFFLEWSCRKIQ